MTSPTFVGSACAALIGIVAAAASPYFHGPPQEARSTDAGQQAAVGRVLGRVTTADAGPLPEVVVYLESLDAGARFSPPTAHAVIGQKGAKFDPPLLVVSIGQTVDFLNNEDRPVQHNVYSKSPAQQFDLGLYKPGISKSVTFETPGPVQLHCSIHRQMDGVIFVSPTPFFARVAPDGNFTIEGVAPGNYELKTWQPKKRLMDKSSRVAVQVGQATPANLELSHP